MEMTVAQAADLETIIELIAQGKQYLKERGIDQWQNGYPDRDCISRDIQQQKGYLVKEKTQTIGYLCVDFDGECAYEALVGEWISDQPYGVVHRLAIDSSCRGKGLSYRIFDLAEKLCRSKSIHSMKVDTDPDNALMKHVLQKCGFTYCGTVCFEQSQKIAYEKLI